MYGIQNSSASEAYSSSAVQQAKAGTAQYSGGESFFALASAAFEKQASIVASKTGDTKSVTRNTKKTDNVLQFADVEIPSEQGNRIVVSAPAKAGDSCELHITLASGVALNLALTGNVRINEGSDGSVSVYYADTGTTTTFDALGNMTMKPGELGQSGTDGDDILININGDVVNGGDGNDIILNLVKNAIIWGGMGDDRLFMPILADGATIDMGDGNDSVHAKNINNSAITMGNGNDSLTAYDVTNSHINMGEGNNSVSLHDVYRTDIHMGDGNNTVKMNKMGVGTSIVGGNGNNTLDIASLLKREAIILGLGNNRITVAGERI